MKGERHKLKPPAWALATCVAWLGLWDPSRAHGQSTGNTVGLTFHSGAASAGYTLFSPGASRNAYLIDIQGQVINRWVTPYFPGMAAYLLDNGNLLRSARVASASFQAGGSGGRVEEYAWDGPLVWGYTYSTAAHRQHHDAIKLPNGNVLMIAWELKTSQEAVAAGRNPALLAQGALWPDTLIEVRPEGTAGGTIVWEWHAWDHLVQDHSPASDNHGVVSDHPELIDVNFPGTSNADWLHCNGLAYHAGLDQIVLSVHAFDEIWVLDHSTTTEEAAGHSGGRHGRGGDILYRWGNPQAYRAGTAADQKLFGQHNPAWIDEGLPGAGRMLIFNNGGGRAGGLYSSIDEIVPPMDGTGTYTNAPGAAFGPEHPVWQYVAAPPGSFYAQNVSGAQRLPNGNTLICSGPDGVLFEVTPAGETVWEYICPVTANGLLVQGTLPPASNLVFRSPRYAPDHPGLAGRDLTPHGTVERMLGVPFRLTDIAVEEGGIRVRWNSEAGGVYQALWRQDIPGTDWEMIGTVTAIGTSAFILDAESARLDGGQGFYRVQLGN